MRIRPFRDESDARELLGAHGRAWEAAYEGLLPAALIERVASAPADPERVREAYEDLASYGEGRVLVAEDDSGAVIGYALFRWGEDETKPTVREGEAELKELYVDPDRWGEGVGTALLEAGLENVPADVDSLALEALAGNDVAAGFYEGHDFEADGESTVEVAGERYPTVVYRKPL